jgi:outer membrane lipoprotein
MKRNFQILLFLAIFAFSCAPFPQEVMRQLDANLTYALVRKNPEAYRGKTILWGGVIIETINRPGETLIQVRQAELDYEKRPTNKDRSAGRFLVQSSGFLDPAIYAKGREITVAGELAGTKVLALGETQYTYPLVLAKEIRLWEKPQEIGPYDPYYWPYWGYPYGWWYPYPFWGYRPYRW